MINYIKKTVFNSNSEGLVNTINCDGVMGAGLALEFALRYPDMYNQYVDDCKNKKVKIGEILTYRTNDSLVINFPTKLHWQYPSQLSWIEKGLEYIANHYKEWNIKSIAIPPLGCSNGGLDFECQVKPLIEKKLNEVDILISICIDPGYPEGKEKQMLDAFLECNIDELCESLKIKGRARAGLTNYKSIKRFYEIKELDGVGITTYKKLFNHFYFDKKAVFYQQSLFD